MPNAEHQQDIKQNKYSNFIYNVIGYKKDKTVEIPQQRAFVDLLKAEIEAALAGSAVFVEIKGNPVYIADRLRAMYKPDTNLEGDAILAPDNIDEALKFLKTKEGKEFYKKLNTEATEIIAEAKTILKTNLYKAKYPSYYDSRHPEKFGDYNNQFAEEHPELFDKYYIERSKYQENIISKYKNTDNTNYYINNYCAGIIESAGFTKQSPYALHTDGYNVNLGDKIIDKNMEQNFKYILQEYIKVAKGENTPGKYVLPKITESTHFQLLDVYGSNSNTDDILVPNPGKATEACFLLSTTDLFTTCRNYTYNAYYTHTFGEKESKRDFTVDIHGIFYKKQQPPAVGAQVSADIELPEGAADIISNLRAQTGIAMATTSQSPTALPPSQSEAGLKQNTV